jgi:transposase
MHDRELYAEILGIRPPWRVVSVELKREDHEVYVTFEHDPTATVACPQCGKESPRHGTRRRTWRHLDTCQFRTLVVAEVPRVECPVHGVHVMQVPWAEPGSRFTALYECLVIDWLKETSISALSRLMGLSWDEIDGIQARAVRRGLARRQPEEISELGVDETSFQRRHEYVTLVYDLAGNRVLYVADDRKRSSLDGFFQELSPEQLGAIDVVAMDMHEPYISCVRQRVPDGEYKIAFDKFHVASHLGDAVDEVRRQEHRELMEQGDARLTGTKYLWLQNPNNMEHDRWLSFAPLRESSLKVARAWALKESAMHLWERAYRGLARRSWKEWLAWALRSQLEPVVRVARMVQSHLQGILNAIHLGITNARSEGMNAKVQWIKFTARGFRNRTRFKNAILFHLGGLDLYPRPSN